MSVEQNREYRNMIQAKTAKWFLEKVQRQFNEEKIVLLTNGVGHPHAKKRKEKKKVPEPNFIPYIKLTQNGSEIMDLNAKCKITTL